MSMHYSHTQLAKVLGVSIEELVQAYGALNLAIRPGSQVSKAQRRKLHDYFKNGKPLPAAQVQPANSVATSTSKPAGSIVLGPAPAPPLTPLSPRPIVNAPVMSGSSSTLGA